MPKIDYERLILNAMSDGRWYTIAGRHGIWPKVQDKRIPGMPERVKTTLFILWEKDKLEHWTDGNGAMWWRRKDVPEPEGGPRPHDIPED